jgi:menaquinone-specific isochorismate synthase
VTAGRTAVARPVAPAELELVRSRAYASGVVFERDGCGVFGLGKAETLRLPLGLRDAGAVEEVAERLAALSLGAEDVSGAAMAVGALPFLPDEPAEMHVPEVTVVSDERGSRAVVVADDGRHEEVWASVLARAASATGDPDVDVEPPPDGFRLESARSHADFLARVDHAIGEVRSGRLDKVVLAREVVVEANRPFRQADLLERLRSLHPSCVTFCVDGFLGATPELLLRRSGREIASDPLAGTAPRSGDPEADRRTEHELLTSEKERAEHRAVVDSIVAGLSPVAERLDVPGAPDILELRNVSHLRTRIRGCLRASDAGPGLPSVLEVLALVHPTPAVSGSPVEVALEYLAKTEELERGRYAGPVGWMRAGGDGEFHLGIRSATVYGPVARLVAGVGIVADSDPAAELRETQLKLQAILAAAVRP